MTGAFLNDKLANAARACRRCAVLAGIVVASVAGPPLAAAGELNIYSHRQQFLLQPFLDAFTAETGIRTKVVYASKGLAQRLLAEGEASPADVILTVDIARLNEYAELDLLAVVDSPVLKANIPASLRAQMTAGLPSRPGPVSSRHRRSVSPPMPSRISKTLPIQNGLAACAAAREAMSIIGP